VQPNYLDCVSEPAKAFYARYMEEYGQEIAEVAGLLSNSSTSLPEASRAWAAYQHQVARL
jgi:hypothetical protein